MYKFTKLIEVFQISYCLNFAFRLQKGFRINRFYPYSHINNNKALGGDVDHEKQFLFLSKTFLLLQNLNLIKGLNPSLKMKFNI
jgi:hypothetical protein